jgi:hypothetical protein
LGSALWLKENPDADGGEGVSRICYSRILCDCVMCTERREVSSRRK